MVCQIVLIKLSRLKPLIVLVFRQMNSTQFIFENNCHIVVFCVPHAIVWAHIKFQFAQSFFRSFRTQFPWGSQLSYLGRINGNDVQLIILSRHFNSTMFVSIIEFKHVHSFSIFQYNYALRTHSGDAQCHLNTVLFCTITIQPHIFYIST